MKTAYWIGAVVLVLIVGGLIVRSVAVPSAPLQGTASSTETVHTASSTVSTNSTGQGAAAASSASGKASSSVPTVTPASQTMTVTYNGTSFSPSTVTLRAGDTVRFIDSSENPMWVASDIHPSHTVYDGSNLSSHCAAGYSGPTPFDECRASTANYSFTFTKKGTWSFHNHLNPSATGKIIVQ